jgi:hypothetical protein
VVADGGTGDQADGNDGVVCVDNVLFGQYEITESGVPTGWFGDTPKTVNVTDPSTCADRLLALDDPDATFVNRQGSILVAKQDGGGNPLPGAGFTFTPNPFTGDATGVEVVDGTTNDHADANDGFVCIDNVRPGTYTVTETTVPAGFFGDGDSESVVVDSPSTCAERLGSVPPDAPDAIFTNLKGSIIIRKEAKDASTEATNDLFAGASFTITPNPTTGTGSLAVTDNEVGGPDQFATGGLICIDGVVKLPAGDSFSIVETNSNNSNYRKDADTESVTVSAASTCAVRTEIDDPDATFVNTPLSKIVVSFDRSRDPT